MSDLRMATAGSFMNLNCPRAMLAGQTTASCLALAGHIGVLCSSCLTVILCASDGLVWERGCVYCTSCLA